MAGASLEATDPHDKLKPICSDKSLASPDLTRSWIMARSNSANTPIIWNIALPAGVVVSIPCLRSWRAWVRGTALVKNSVC